MRIQHRALSVVVGGALAMMATLTTAEAQFGRAAGAAGASFEHYSFTDTDVAGMESISLLTTPLSVSIPISGARFDLSAALARGVLGRADGTTSTITGPTDTHLALTVPLAGEMVRLGAIAVLPTGTTLGGRTQADVIGVVAADLLPLSVSRWASGGGAGLAASLHPTLGAVRLGMGGSYLLTGTHDAAEASGLTAYRPGDQLELFVSADAPVARTGLASLHFRFRNFGTDEMDGSSLYRAGDRFEAMGSYAFVVGERTGAVLYAGGQHRTHGWALLDVAQHSRTQALALAGGGLRFEVGRETVVLPALHARAFRVAGGVGDGFLGGATIGLEFDRGAFRVAPQVRGQVGSVTVGDGSSTGVIGLDLGITLSARAPL